MLAFTAVLSAFWATLHFLWTGHEWVVGICDLSYGTGRSDEVRRPMVNIETGLSVVFDRYWTSSANSLRTRSSMPMGRTARAVFSVEMKGNDLRAAVDVVGQGCHRTRYRGRIERGYSKYGFRLLHQRRGAGHAGPLWRYQTADGGEVLSIAADHGRGDGHGCQGVWVPRCCHPGVYADGNASNTTPTRAWAGQATQRRSAAPTARGRNGAADTR